MKMIDAIFKDILIINGIIITAKRHWGYSDEQIGLWLSGLLVEKSSFNDRRFWLLEHQNQVIGGTSVSCESEMNFELEDCWVLPEFMRLGAGKYMFNYVVEWLEANEAEILRIVADPHAEGFYRHMGAEFIEMKPSMPKGRQIPVFEYKV